MGDTKRDFTNDEIVTLLASLGSPDYRAGTSGELIFQTVCHNSTGGSYKLYYYPSSLFHCYTGCGDSFDAYELVMRSKDYSFIEAKVYVYNVLGIDTRRHGFLPDEDSNALEDWGIFNRFSTKKKDERQIILPRYSKTLAQFHKRMYPAEWLAEGILPRSMDKFQIRYDLLGNKIIIPHFDIDGNLVGIRGRALNRHEAEGGAKYKPITIQGTVMKHPTSHNLYGIHKNNKAIQTLRKIMLFESEKSVLKCDGFYGRDNFTVAVCGSNVSEIQLDMVLKLRANEVFIAFDNERQNDMPPLPTNATKEEREIRRKEQMRIDESNRRYWDKLYSIAYRFCPYAVTYLVCSDDINGLLDYKNAPCDKGQDVFEQLMKNKLEIKTKGEDDEFAKLWKKV